MAARELNITIKLDIDSIDFENEVSRELKVLRSQILEFSDSLDLFSESGAEALKKFGESIGDSLTGNAEPALTRLAKNLRTTESDLIGLISKTKGNLKLEREFQATARAAGLTDGEIQKINRDLEMTNRISGFLVAGMKKVGAAALDFAVSFVSSSVEAGLALEKQNVILKSLSGSEYPKLKEAIDATIESSRGLTNQKQLTEVANDAIKAGVSMDFISKNLSGLQKVSAVTGTSLSSSMTEAYNAIQTGSDDFLKNNGVLFAAYSKEFAQINESGMSEATKRIAREKLVSAALGENSALQSAYGAHIGTSAVVLERFTAIVDGLKSSFGTLILEALGPFLNAFIQIFEYFTVGEQASSRLKGALVILGSVAVGALVAIAMASGVTFASLFSMTAAMIPALFSMAAAGWAAVAPWIPFIVIGLAVAAVIAGIILLVQDLLTWMEGGESVIGKFLGDSKNAVGGDTTRTEQTNNAKAAVDSKEAQKFSLFNMASGFSPDGGFNFPKGTAVSGGPSLPNGYAVPVQPPSKNASNSCCGGIVVNIAKVMLGGASSKEDARLFGDYLEKELEKIAIKIGLGSGMSPEAI
ncbi:LIC12611 family phage tail protein [Leptospira alstonii]|uniref:Uncharacterized protein n=2 Tax=Leptospira alstonii TaxID=28452 RepID=M6CY97_9LEPT|nr:hypothetical protein [Leptospira alstonii]EMJ91265.1 hypothetical protein LEP1GSC194_1028 [Leptospira alstonii serovar Sichuan str. 79601]EQA79251.1 hypothetical protein LEP1GSC193_2762 [Leptospira alstonii serovar Pingchang str. 80-412]